MGKGNRSRNNRYDETYQMTGSDAAVTVGKKDNTSTIILAVIAALIIGALLLYAFAASGIVGRSDVVVSSENYEIDANMMTYFQNMAYSNTFQQYYYYYYLYFYAGDADAAYAAVQNMMSQYTLRSFFDTALTTAKEVLIMCEGAKAAGIELTDEELSLLNEQIDAFDGSFAENFGTGVSKKDIRKAMTLYQLAAKYAEQKTEEIKDSVTDEDVLKYVEDHKEDFYSASYLVYEFSLNASKYTDNEEGFAADKALADKFVAALAASKTEDEFRTTVVNYIADRDFRTEFDKNVGEATVPEDAVLDAAKEKIAEALVKELVGGETVGSITVSETYTAIFDAVHKALKTTAQKAVSALESSAAYNEDATDDYAKWLLAEDTKALDTKTVDDSSDSEYSKTVYMVTEPLHLDERDTQSVAHILIKAEKDKATEEETAAAKAKAEEALAKFKAGETTLDAFEKLAETYNEDSNCVYENFSEGQMVEEFETWAFDEARKEGDVEIVQTEFGFHIMYYIGEGLPVYEANAKSAIANEKYTEFVEKESASLTVNQKAVDKYGE